MKTNPFKLAIVVTILISIVVVSSLVIGVLNNLTRIPSAESGLIVSKSVIGVNDSVVNLPGNSVLLNYQALAERCRLLV
jgi:hypothetical protein